jgi:protocatechuate 3,4-dioxygenase beta subunit
MLLLFLALLAAPQDQPEKPCTLSGTVVNALTGETLNKVRIVAEGGDSPAVPVTTTDAKGRFTLVNLTPGTYRLKAQRNGYLDGYYGARRPEGNGIPIALESGQQMKDLAIKLTPFGVIAGTVRDADGEPLARITVTVHRLKFENGFRHVAQVGGAYTDDLGQYRIPDLPPGKYYVHAEGKKAREFGSMSEIEQETEDHSPKDAGPALMLLPAMFPGVQEVSGGARVTGVDISLPRSTTVTVKGHASALAGMHINGIHLNYADAASDQLGLQLFTGTNDKGEFAFGGVPPGSYILTAAASPPAKPFNGTIEMFQQEVKTRMPLQVGAIPIEGLRVVVEAGAEVTGRVTVADDDKVDVGFGTLGFTDGQAEPLHAMVTAGGDFKTTLPTGRYTVLTNEMYRGDLVVRSIRAAGRNVLDEGLTISEPGKVALEIVLAHEGGQLDGVVLGADDKPVAGAVIVLAPDARRRSRTDLFQQTETDQYGRFSMDGITPGDYKLFAWDDVEPGIWWDPDFLKKFEAHAESVTIAAKAKATAKVHLPKE